jgi:hypothetical protein
VPLEDGTDAGEAGHSSTFCNVASSP